MKNLQKKTKCSWWKKVYAAFKKIVVNISAQFVMPQYSGLARLA